VGQWIDRIWLTLYPGGSRQKTLADQSFWLLVPIEPLRAAMVALPLADKAPLTGLLIWVFNPAVNFLC
jgi:hypothetical protein